MKIMVGKWWIEANEDEDGHLNIRINHSDNSGVIQFEEDISTNDTEWSDRFTTTNIEKDYQKTLTD